MDFDIDISTIPMHQQGMEPVYNGEAQFGVRSLEQSPSMRNIGVSADTFPSLDLPGQLWIWGPPFAFPKVEIRIHAIKCYLIFCC
jgi:hypothetical protein